MDRNKATGSQSKLAIFHFAASQNSTLTQFRAWNLEGRWQLQIAFVTQLNDAFLIVSILNLHVLWVGSFEELQQPVPSLRWNWAKCGKGIFVKNVKVFVCHLQICKWGLCAVCLSIMEVPGLLVGCNFCLGKCTSNTVITVLQL